MATEEPVIALHGPRSVGKSTLLATFAAARAVPVLDLDDDAVRDAVLANPSFAIGEHTPVCLDEYQRAPGVLERSRPGSTGLSQGEIGGTTEDLVTALRADPAGAVGAHPSSSTVRADYVERICLRGQ